MYQRNRKALLGIYLGLDIIFLRSFDKNKIRIHKILRTHLSRHVQDHDAGGSHLERFAQNELDLSKL